MTERRDLADLRRDWTALGEADPFWAVCVDPAKRGGRWDVDEFLASGRDEIAETLAALDRLGMDGPRHDALDFGCGVGRLTAALAEHFGTVTGVDISPSMLSHARALHASNSRCCFVYNDRPDLSMFPDDSFDLVYSSLVLQHVAPALSDSYLAEFVRVVRPGGSIAIVAPQRHLRTPRGLVYAYAPHVLVAWLQRSIFGFPAAMRMHTVPDSRVRRVIEPLDARLVGSVPRPLPGHWLMSAHFISVCGSSSPAG